MAKQVFSITRRWWIRKGRAMQTATQSIAAGLHLKTAPPIERHGGLSVSALIIEQGVCRAYPFINRIYCKIAVCTIE